MLSLLFFSWTVSDTQLKFAGCSLACEYEEESPGETSLMVRSKEKQLYSQAKDSLSRL